MNARTSLLIIGISAAAACHRKAPERTAPAPIATTGVLKTKALESRARQGSLVVSTRFRDTDVELALISDEDEHALLLVNVDSGEIQARKHVEGRPAQALVLANGQVALALRDKASVVTLSVEPGEGPEPFRFVEEATLRTEAEPLALAVSAESEGPRQLYVATGHGHTLEQFDVASQKKKFIFEIAREPRAVVALEDGTVMVSHANAGVLTKVKGKEVIAMRLDQGDVFARQGFALASIGNEAFAPDTFVLPEDLSASMRGHAGGYGGGMVCEQEGWHRGWVLDQKPPASVATQVQAASTNAKAPQGKIKKRSNLMASREAGFAHFNAERPVPGLNSFDCVQVMSTSGALRRATFNRALVTQMGTTCILPRAAAAHEGRHEVYLACLGTNRIEAVDLGQDASQEVTEKTPAPKFARGWAVPKGPVGLAVQEDALLVWSQFDRSLTRINLASGAAKSVTLHGNAEIDRVLAQGRELFHAAGDPRIAQDGRACASCHPDGLSDGIGWATPEGRRKPMLLAGRIAEGPFGWRGEHKTLREHLTQTITRNLHGTGLSPDAMTALETYVRSLPAPPTLVDASLSAEAKRGKELFAGSDTGCATCHNPESGFTDGARHDVGTGGSFRTPPLRLASAAMPYMHQAKYARLDEFLRQTEGKMGHTAQLSETDFLALVTYVNTL